MSSFELVSQGTNNPMMTDPIADMLTRIRNAVRVERPSVDMPISKVKRGLAEVLKREGYIWDWKEVESAPGQPIADRIEIWPQRGAGDSPFEARQQAGPPRVRRRRSVEADPQRPGNFDPQHQSRSDQRPRSPPAESGRRSALRVVVGSGSALAGERASGAIRRAEQAKVASMSRIGKVPVPVPAGVKVAVADGAVAVEGPLGQAQADLPAGGRRASSTNRASVSW